MTDMITWLRAQLDEDGQESHELLRMWEHTDGAVATDKRKAVALLEWRLADIAAKRAILDAGLPEPGYFESESEVGEHIQFAGWSSATCSDDCGPAVWWAVVKYLAYAYRHRPGYLPEWAPEGAGQ